jgi:hypothetical protein
MCPSRKTTLRFDPITLDAINFLVGDVRGAVRLISIFLVTQPNSLGVSAK